MIQTKKDLAFYIKADYMMNRGYFKPTIKQRIKEILSPDYIMDYLVTLRKCAYYTNKRGGVPILLLIKYKRLGLKLGFTIGYNSLGYGAVLPHYGTIIIGNTNRIGNYAVIHACTCVSGNGKTIGDGFYLAVGGKVTTKCVIGNNVSVGANSLVNKDFPEDNILIGGVPAQFIKSSIPWYVRDGAHYECRHAAVEELKNKIY